MVDDQCIMSRGGIQELIWITVWISTQRRDKIRSTRICHKKAAATAADQLVRECQAAHGVSGSNLGRSVQPESYFH
jgi:hypothetical protein